MDNLKLFIYTIKEYKRFSKEHVKHEMLDTYDESSYIETQTKLVLLRKYACYNENVYIEKIINILIEKYPDEKEELEKIFDGYSEIEKQQLEYILPDGTKLNLYQTIEDTMYGLYLHADEQKINRLIQTSESLRFICIRKYVEELEEIIFKIFNFLEKKGELQETINEENRASVIYLGDTSINLQGIKKSPYWSNLYGNDASEKDLKQIIKNCTEEEMEILAKSLLFLKGLELQKIDVLDSLIFSTTKKDWGDYSVARSFYQSINKIGISTRVRYNDEHTIAYVTIFQQVDNPFVISTSHIVSGLYEIALVKENNEWKIYSMGGHLE